MKESLKHIIVKNRVDLTHDIVLNDDLWQYLTDKKIVTDVAKQDIMSQFGNTRGRIGALLDLLIRRPDTDFNEFCNCLEETNQGHIVRQYLKKKEGKPRTSSRPDDDAAGNIPLEEMTPLKNDVPQDMNDGAGSNPTNCCGVPQYCKNHKNVIMIATAALLFIVVASIAVPLAITSDENALQATGNPTVLPYSVKLDINEACGGNNTLYRLHDAQGDSRCQSNSGNSFLEDPRSCSKFEFCCQQDSQRGDGSCPEHYTFHPESQSCEFTKKTFYRDPYDCGKYHRCFQDGKSAKRIEQRCNTGLHLIMDTPDPTCAHKEDVFDCTQPETAPTNSQGID